MTCASLTYEQFLNKLEKAGIAYTLWRSDSAIYVEIGRLAYKFQEDGECHGGWIRNCAEDWRSEWQKWVDLLTEPIS